MNKIKNLHRYWLDKDSHLFMRQWTDEEYQTLDPHTHIFEKYWSYRCPMCNFIPIPVLTKEEAERTQTRHINQFSMSQNRKRHKGFVEYRDHELVCYETKDEFLKDIGIWVAKQEIY